MEMVIESDSEESVVFVDKGNDNMQAIDNNDGITDTELDSESDSYELLDMVIDIVPSSAASSSVASSSADSILMAHNLLMCLRSLGALCRPLPREGGSARALSTSRLARTCRSWRCASRSSA